LFIFGGQEFIHHSSVLGKCEVSSSKNKRLSKDPRNMKLQFSRNWTKQLRLNFTKLRSSSV
jgi:hypothetical protein